MSSRTETLAREKKWTLPAGIVSVAGVAMYFIGQLVGSSGLGSPEGSAEISMIAQAATAGIYPIPRSGARLISMLVAVGVVVGMATAGGVSLVAASL